MEKNNLEQLGKKFKKGPIVTTAVVTGRPKLILPDIINMQNYEKFRFNFLFTQ
jgi:hypothetical protein